MGNESVEEFLKRGGTINHIPEGTAGQASEPRPSPRKRKHKKRDHCESCDKREGCSTPDELRELCRKLEQYLTQTVDIRQTEQPIRREYDRLCPGAWPAIPDTRKLIIRMFFTEHKTVGQISEILGISHQRVSQITQRIIKNSQK